MKNSITAFFPAYNDEGTVEKMVEGLRKVLEDLTKDYEIIIVNDCSPDRTGEIANKMAKKYKEVRVIHHNVNKGYGGALKSGFYNSTKEWIFYTDGDAQYNVDELRLLWPYKDKYDVVNGDKIKRADNFTRSFLGAWYNLGVKIVFNLKIRDVDCDFRLMKRKIFGKVKLENDSGLICPEMMRKIQNEGFTIKNVPVHHFPRVSGQSQFFKISKLRKVFEGLPSLWWNLVFLWNLKKIFNPKSL